MADKEHSQNPEGGHLVIIGGGEDRKNDKKILCRFIELAGGPDSKIAVLTAASMVPDELWQTYDRAFADLGVRTRVHIHANDRYEANDPKLAEELMSADGIFMTGGNQRRLLATIGGTELDTAMHCAFREHGACIGGTSAGASAMSGHMLAEGSSDLQPEKGSANLGAGLGFLQHAIVDQHFSERQRLARLLSVVAQNPYLFGIGIDEDTALIIERGGAIEVLGEGAVTVIDGRKMLSNFLETEDRETLELINVKLHLLPAGRRYAMPGHAGRNGHREVPEPLQDFLSLITRQNAMQ